jgi:hypothetical protein
MGTRHIAQEQDRLRLYARGAEEPEPFLADIGVRQLVRKHRTRLVRLRRDGHDRAVPLARDPVRPDVVLRRQPDRGLVVVPEDPVGEPPAIETARVLR